MFESVKTLDDGPNGLVRFASFLVSVAVHGAIIGLIVLVPLVFCDVLPENSIITILMEAPPTPPPLPPPTPPTTNTAAGSKKIVISNDGLVEPSAIPTVIPGPDDDPVVINTDIADIGIGVGPRGSGGTGPGKDLIALLTKDIKVDVPPPPKRPERKQVRVAGTVQQSKLIHRVDPIYPPLAIKTHTQGEVVLEAIIDEEGNVMQPVKILKGHPLLVDAAVQAVSQWKYSPTIQGGEPLQVVAMITVVFTLK